MTRTQMNEVHSLLVRVIATTTQNLGLIQTLPVTVSIKFGVMLVRAA